MLVNADVKGLEVVVAAQLSGDEVLSREIVEFHNGLRSLDVHGQNEKDFGLPSRFIAKIFKFRLIYGGSAYSYAHDPDFMGVSTNQSFWQEVIDKYYAKYYGMARWHNTILAEAKVNSRLTIPSGRYFPFSYEPTKYGLRWPDTKCKNYPVQGFGADLVKLARLEVYKRLRKSGLRALLVSTIHDSIVVDCPEEEVMAVAKILYDSILVVPELCLQVWNYNFVLPITSEIQVGPNKKDMKDIDIKTLV